MFKTFVYLSLTAVLLLSGTYLLFSPINSSVPVWEVPKNKGYSGVFAKNDLLEQAQLFSLGTHQGPEDIAIDAHQRLYTATQDGWILRTEKDTTEFKPWLKLEGRSLGLAFDNADNLIVANTHQGLVKITPSKEVTILSAGFDERAYGFIDDVEVMPNGDIFFSDASSFYAARHYGAYKASALDIIGHGAYGRVYKYQPSTNTTEQVLDKLHFVNGIALSHDQQSLLFAETANYSISRLWLGGDKKGQTELLIDNLPGLPDNIKKGLDGRYWVGLVIPRNPLLDAMADNPSLRKVVMRLNKLWVLPGAPRTHVIAINDSGQVLYNLQEAFPQLSKVTGAVETAAGIYLSSLDSNKYGFLRKPFAQTSTLASVD